MDTTTILFFAAASLAVVATPGPTMLLALSNGASHGVRIAAFGIAGAALSDLLLIGAVSLGLGALLAASESLFAIVKLAGILYLVWLAIQLWRCEPAAPPIGSSLQLATRASPQRAFARSLLVALSNPKGLLFFSAFLPQFIHTTEPQALQYLVLAAVFTGIDIVLMVCYALGGVQAARVLSVPGLRLLNRACASVLLALAAFLAVYRRSNA